MYEQTFVISQLVWKPIVVQYATCDDTIHTYNERGLDYQVGDIFCPAVKQHNNICIFMSWNMSGEDL